MLLLHDPQGRWPWLTWAAAKRGTIDVIEVPRAGSRFGAAERAQVSRDLRASAATG